MNDSNMAPTYKISIYIHILCMIYVHYWSPDKADMLKYSDKNNDMANDTLHKSTLILRVGT